MDTRAPLWESLFDLDGGHPIRALFGRQAPPFTSNGGVRTRRRIVCGRRLWKQSDDGRKGKSNKTKDGHSKMHRTRLGREEGDEGKNPTRLVHISAGIWFVPDFWFSKEARIEPKIAQIRWLVPRPFNSLRQRGDTVISRLALKII